MMTRDNVHFILITMAVVFIITACAGYFFLFTSQGAGEIARFVIAWQAGSEKVSIGRTEGTVLKGVSFHNVAVRKLKRVSPEAELYISRLDCRFAYFNIKGLVIDVYGGRFRSDNITVGNIEGSLKKKLSLQEINIKNIWKLPKGAEIRIQRIDCRMPDFSIKGLEADIYNGRLQLLYSDTILFYGIYSSRLIDLTVYSKRLNVREILDLVASKALFPTASGVLGDVNIHVRGALASAAVEGKFFIERINNKSFSLIDAPGSLLFNIEDITGKPSINGEFVCNSGAVSGRNTALVRLKQSRIIYEGDIKNPKFNIRGSAKIEDTRINAVLQGTFGAPQLRLVSSPPLREEVLLLMLATGKSWGGTRVSFDQGKMSTDMIKDFIDYFVFSGKGSLIAKSLGISDISVTYDSQTKEIGVKTAISDKVEMQYVIEPNKEEQGNVPVKQTVSGEYKITDTISVEAEKELQKDNGTSAGQEKSNGVNKVILQFKKEF